MGYDDLRFQQQMQQALAALRAVLATAKNPQLLHDVPHQYADKYAAAEFLTNTAIAAAINALGPLGLGPDQLRRLLSWNRAVTITLRFECQETCQHIREQTRDVESASTLVTERSRTTRSGGQPSSETERLTSKVVTKVTEHLWRFEAAWRLLAFPRNLPEEAVVLGSRTGQAELVTPTELGPRPVSLAVPPIDVQLTSLLDLLDADLRPQFKIKRWASNCHTPRRNPEVDSLIAAFNGLSSWADAVSTYFLRSLFAVKPHTNFDLQALQTVGTVFIPVLPVAYDAKDGKRRRTEALPDPGAEAAAVAPAGDGPLALPEVADLNLFLAEQQRTLEAKLKEVAGGVPGGEAAGEGLVTMPEARMVVVLLHLQQVGQRYCDAVDYVEDLLRRQLVTAVGRVVTPQDLAQYMELHYRRLFRDAFRPTPFCYAVRRPQHYPEGLVCLEAEEAAGAAPQPIHTLCHAFDHPARTIHFPIDAATTVQCDGPHYVHAFVSHQFLGQRSPRLFLAARARQFSSFLVLVGRIPSRDTFEPVHACLLQNKDELRIPLDLEEIPTPKAFRDAIESLSPEQQRFARAIRSMQLASTLFGVLVIQVKPQLERLLRLPGDSLTKEIQLTQDLMELFIKYQVPSDLLTACHEGAEVPPADQAVEKVKGHVAAVKTMLQGARTKELQAEAERREKAGQHLFGAPPTPPPQMWPMMAQPCFGAPSPSGCLSFGAGGGGFGASAGGGSFGAALPIAPTTNPITFGPPVPSAGAGRSFGAPPAPPCADPFADFLADAPPQLQQRLPPPPPPPATGMEPPRATREEPTAPPEPSEPAVVDPSEAAESQPLDDYTQLPTALDRRLEQLDVDSALQPTIIKPGGPWQRRSQDGLLSDMAAKEVGPAEQKAMRQQALDLLDALSRSGTLPLTDAELHIVVAATHRFDQSLMDTVIRQNVNPVERVERSAIIMAATIHALPPAQLLKAAQEGRVREHSALLFQ